MGIKVRLCTEKNESAKVLSVKLIEVLLTLLKLQLLIPKLCQVQRSPRSLVKAAYATTTKL